MDDGGAPLPSKDEELVAESFRSIFPNGLPPAHRGNYGGTAIVRAYELEEEHLLALAAHLDDPTARLGVERKPLQRISRTHHRMAQLLAGGMQANRVAVICNVQYWTVTTLQSDPMFQELLAYYSNMVSEEFRTVIEEMADLHGDVVNELRDRLMNNPETFTVASLTELMKSLSDRTGNGPSSSHTSRSFNVALSAEDLERIKSGPSAPRGGDGQDWQLTSEDRRVIDGVFSVSAADVQPGVGTEGLRQGQGLRVRAEGDEAAPSGVADGQPPVPRVD